MIERGRCGAILVVEDEPAALALFEHLLEEAGFVPLGVLSGELGLAAARTTTPAAAILDVDLPGCSGYEVCRELRLRHGTTLPILFVSGERKESYDRVAGLLLGGDDYLVKPFDPSELVARLEALLRRARATGRRALTAREREVLALLAEGLDQDEIAARLQIRPRTVATHLDRTLSKLGVHNRAQAVALAYREMLVGR